ncbi:hypothetical protein C9374_001618 [Naegleria lovaniensis]|uniref:PX domain-containing protein n=1 Tax=Naegleria lovaniensis TaxID=51637 RepID=A0AA88GRW9_NAELO|nr:uncharacterized protein C9374_001618 [Naegleria lovaniensis]KAG2387286.1 hypothetical protein C9374_001618 [Naegleria lovaniensis]
MFIKIIQYQVVDGSQSGDKKPFVLYTIQVFSNHQAKEFSDKPAALVNKNHDVQNLIMMVHSSEEALIPSVHAPNDDCNTSASNKDHLEIINMSSGQHNEVTVTSKKKGTLATPFDREYQYSHFEEFDDDNMTNTASTPASSSSSSSLNENQSNGHTFAALIESGSESFNSSNHGNITASSSMNSIASFYRHLDSGDCIIAKRYSEILEFHQRFIELSPDFARELKPFFPKKLIMGNLKKENIEKRVSQLNEYFEKMVQILDIEIRSNTKLQKLVSHFFLDKPVVLSTSNPTKNQHRNVDWMLHKAPKIRNNWFFSAPNGFERFNKTFDRRTEFISPIFQGVSIEQLLTTWEIFISKQEKVELLDSNTEFYLFTYRQATSLIYDYITVQFVQDKQTMPSPATIDEKSSPAVNEQEIANQDERDADNLSDITPPSFGDDVVDILRRYSIRKSTAPTNSPKANSSSISTMTNVTKFSMLVYSRSAIDFSDTHEKRVKTWLVEFRNMMIKEFSNVRFANTFA